MKKKIMMEMKIEYDENNDVDDAQGAVAEVVDLLVSNDPNALNPKIQEH